MTHPVCQLFDTVLSPFQGKAENMPQNYSSLIISADNPHEEEAEASDNITQSQTAQKGDQSWHW